MSHRFILTRDVHFYWVFEQGLHAPEIRAYMRPSLTSDVRFWMKENVSGTYKIICDVVRDKEQRSMSFAIIDFDDLREATLFALAWDVRAWPP